MFGFSLPSFSAKVSRKLFSPDDLERLLRILVKEDVEEFFKLKRIRELKNLENVSLTDAEKEQGWK